MKQYLSSELKSKLMYCKTQVKDLFRSNLKFAKPSKHTISDTNHLHLTQSLGTSESKFDKLKNMQLAIETIQTIVIYPNEIFSFVGFL